MEPKTPRSNPDVERDAETYRPHRNSDDEQGRPIPGPAADDDQQEDENEDDDGVE